MLNLEVPETTTLDSQDIAAMEDEFLRLFRDTPVERGDRTDSQRYMTKLWYKTVTNWLYTRSLKQLLVNDDNGSDKR